MILHKFMINPAFSQTLVIASKENSTYNMRHQTTRDSYSFHSFRVVCPNFGRPNLFVILYLHTVGVIQK